jgi:hypothetical protein
MIPGPSNNKGLIKKLEKDGLLPQPKKFQRPIIEALRKNPNMVIEKKRPRAFGKTYEMFVECMKIAKAGKTFLYVHPNFVAIDVETWRVMQAKLSAPVIYYDESSFISDKDLKTFDKELKAFKKRK